MSDETFRQRKKSVPDDLGDFNENEENPLEKVRQMQQAVASETGREPAPEMVNDPPFAIGGQMPEAFKRALQQRGLSEDDVVAPTVNRPRPKTKAVPESKLRVTGSEELEELLARLQPHNNWESLELPSKGKFYENIPGVLNIRPMTGGEEQILATPRYVRKGRAIDMIFKSCIKENINTEELLSVDRTYLLIYLRGISYTPEYDVEIKCVECGTKFNTVIDLNSLEVEACPEAFNPEDLIGTLPTSGFRYKYHLASGGDEQAITRYREARVREYGDQNDDDTLLYRTALLLDWIEGVKDRNELNLLLKKLPINDVSHLRNVINDPPFGVDTEIGIVCPACAAEFEIDLPLEANFFFPRKKEMRTRA